MSLSNFPGLKPSGPDILLHFSIPGQKTRASVRLFINEKTGQFEVEYEHCTPTQAASEFVKLLDQAMKDRYIQQFAEEFV